MLLSDQGVPPALTVIFAEHHLTLRPHWVMVHPDSREPCLLVQVVPAEQGLVKTYRSSWWKASSATGMMEPLQIRVEGVVKPLKLSFRALDIEQIGHVYEGLLDHTAMQAKGTILGLVGTKNKELEVLR